MLFGSTLPDTLDYSRPIRTFNSLVVGGPRTHYHLVRYKAEHLNPIWDAIAAYIQNGPDAIPVSVP